MKAGSGLALCALCLCAAAPLEARDKPGARAAARHNPALSGIARLPAVRSPLPSDGPRVRFVNETIIRHDGTPGDRRSVVGSLPLVGQVAAEVGLFSVTGAEVKEREFRRSDPMADVQPRRSRVAAVGLRMSF